MRSGYASSLILTLIFSAGYLWFIYEPACDIPIGYRIASIDERFNLSREEAEEAVEAAVALWENVSGEDLFVPDPYGELPIYFVFDGRQAQTNQEEVLRKRLDEKRELSESVRERYDDLIAKYDTKRSLFEAEQAQYDQKLSAYNQEVAQWNRSGGAPEDVYLRLENEKVALDTELRTLDRESQRLNELVWEINHIGEEGNTLVDTYNESVESYNERFSEGREFTQGNYTGSEINVYQYRDFEELELVLAHELGHALSIGHVEDPTAIMHSFMGEQDILTGLVPDDVAAFTEQCTERSLIERFSRLW